MAYPVLTKSLSWLGRLGRSIMNRFMYSQLAVFTGLKIAIGKEKPLIPFRIEMDPPSIYWVYKIRSSEIEGLAEKLGIPSQFTLSPIKCLDTDDPGYFIVLNAYRVSGLAKGIRAEWSIFVRDANNIPRYMVVDARSSTTSVDPVSIITKASTVVHERSGDTIRTEIGEGDEVFSSTMTLPPNTPSVIVSPEWVSANDYIYWGNGICDRTFYSGGLANAQVLRVGSDHCVSNDGSFWSQLVDPDPVHILVYNNVIDLVISPWENVDKAHLT